MMTPILIQARVGIESGWIAKRDCDQIRFHTTGKFSIKERLTDDSIFESEIHHMSIITLTGDTKWIKVKYLEGDEPADVELI
jgi:hypothetical protein